MLARRSRPPKHVSKLQRVIDDPSECIESVVVKPCSEDTKVYMAEACKSYRQGLHTASALCCRALIECALKRRVPSAKRPSAAVERRTRQRH
jgi:hypothetical protein